MKINRYGLSRNIPVDVAREIRRQSKFGCVIYRVTLFCLHLAGDFKVIHHF